MTIPPPLTRPSQSDEPQGPAHLRPAGALARFRAGRLGLTAAGSVAFARGLARTPAVHRTAPLVSGLREAADVGAPAAPRSVRVPRWWSPSPEAPTDDAVAPRPARTPVAVTPRGLARAASRIDRDSWTPGRLGVSAAPKAVPMRLPAEVAAAGSMVTSLDSRRRNVAPSRGPAPRSAGSGPTDGAAGSRRAAGPAAAQTPPRVPASAPTAPAAGAPALPAVRRHTAPPRLARRRAAAARTAASARATLVGRAPAASVRPTVGVPAVATTRVSDVVPTAEPPGEASTTSSPAAAAPVLSSPVAAARDDAPGHRRTTRAAAHVTGLNAGGSPVTHPAVRRASSERHPGTWAASLPRAASSRALLGHAPEAAAVTRSAPVLRRSTALAPASVAAGRTSTLTLRPATLIRPAEEPGEPTPAAHAGTRGPTVGDAAPATRTAPASSGGAVRRTTHPGAASTADTATSGPSTARVGTHDDAGPSFPRTSTDAPGAAPVTPLALHVPLRRALAATGSTRGGAFGTPRSSSLGAPQGTLSVRGTTHTSSVGATPTRGTSAAPDYAVVRGVRPVPGALARSADVRGAAVASARPGRVTAVRRQVAVTRRDDAAAAAQTRPTAEGTQVRTVAGVSTARPAGRPTSAGLDVAAAAPRPAGRPAGRSASRSASTSPTSSSAAGILTGATTGSVRAAATHVGPRASATAPDRRPDRAPSSPSSDVRLASGPRAVRRATGPTTPLAVGGSPAHHAPTAPRGTAPVTALAGAARRPADAPAHPWGHAPVRRSTSHGRTGGASVVGRATPPVAGLPTGRGPAVPASASAWRSSLTDAASVPLRRSVLPPRAPVRTAGGPAVPSVPAVAHTAAGAPDDTAAGLSILRRALARADATTFPSTEEPSMSTLPTTGTARGRATSELHLDERLLARLADALEDDLTDRVARRVERRLLEETALRTTGLTPGAF